MCMSKISYDVYDELCDSVSDFGDFHWIPTEAETDRMSVIGMTFFMALIARTLEADRALDDEEEKQLAYLNKTVIRNVEFLEDEPEMTEEIPISYKEYDKICEFVVKADIDLGQWFPNLKEIESVIKPNIRYCFALVLVLLNGANEKQRAKECDVLRQLVQDSFELTGLKKEVSMNRAEYEALCGSMSGIKLERENWCPSVEEIDTIIVPNFKKCYDFVIWLLETGKTPSTDNDKVAAKKLHQVMKEHMSVKYENCSIW